jgi:recombination protein RecT
MSTENSTAVAELKRDISTQVLAKIDAFQKAGELTLPKDYNVENALKSAYLILSDPKENLLNKCDKVSVAEALLKMVVHGVSPIKKQCYFIPYGDKLSCTISYFGNIAIAKRYGGLKWIKGNAVFKGDTFEFMVDAETGRRKIVKHTQSLESFGSKEIVGAYAVYEVQNGIIDVEVMNINQIKDAWNQGATKGASPAHKNFPDQMAVRTVINRACKILISSSDDSALYDSLNDDEGLKDYNSENIEHEVKSNANKEVLDFSEEVAQTTEFEVIEPQTAEPEKQPAKKSDAPF